MPPETAPQLRRSDLSRALGAAGEEEYAQLVSLLRDCSGGYALLPVRSDFDVARRDLLLDRLAQDILPLRLTRVRAPKAGKDLVKAICSAACDRDQVIALIDLEILPDALLPSAEREARSPLLASLNLGRESLRRSGIPIMLWCSGAVWQALRRDAPDFFDHFTALFDFRRADYEDYSGRRLLDGSRNAVQRIEHGTEDDVAFYEALVAETRDSNEEHVNALLGLAGALWKLHDAHPTARLLRALDLTDQALRMTNSESYNFARAQLLKGLILQDLATGDRASNLQKAIACYEAALRILTEADFPTDWATTQNNLGNVYQNLPTGDRAANLQRAIACYEAALRVYTEADFPMHWATTQNNLGNAYLYLPTGDRASNLQRAVACYEAALRVHTKANFPIEWAGLQNNLGSVYRNLPTGDKASNLQRAIACYEAALRIRTEADFPSDWATTQNNLGNAYLYLPTGDRACNLQSAIVCYEAALHIRTETDFPVEYGNCQVNLGNAWSELGDREHAKMHFRNAIRGYAAAGLASDWEWRAYAERRLKELDSE